MNLGEMKPEFFLFSGFIFTVAYVVYITTMIVHIFTNSFMDIVLNRIDLVPQKKTGDFFFSQEPRTKGHVLLFSPQNQQ